MAQTKIDAGYFYVTVYFSRLLPRNQSLEACIRVDSAPCSS
ncbi:hypothetical protein RK21_02887 [Pseudomonas plecoglossicida]|nr:hypothetical protein RK21_02887 [Pseudomonas plecoglossicida]